MRRTRDLARVGWRELAPFLPIGPRERPRLADSFSRLGQARGASDPPGRSTSDPKSGRYARERASTDDAGAGVPSDAS